MGRTLPNMFALTLMNFALYQMIEIGTSRSTVPGVPRAVALLTFAAVVIRAELVALSSIHCCNRIDRLIFLGPLAHLARVL
ncbi:hypothetical protein EI94DRAFT_1212851 [Lactarius quietus]|nr:hypothetical protein EI94DRAFT_1212851 [Lactarius quietus]